MSFWWHEAETGLGGMIWIPTKKEWKFCWSTVLLQLVMKCKFYWLIEAGNESMTETYTNNTPQKARKKANNRNVYFILSESKSPTSCWLFEEFQSAKCLQKPESFLISTFYFPDDPSRFDNLEIGRLKARNGSNLICPETSKSGRRWLKIRMISEDLNVRWSINRFWCVIRNRSKDQGWECLTRSLM